MLIRLRILVTPPGMPELKFPFLVGTNKGDLYCSHTAVSKTSTSRQPDLAPASRLAIFLQNLSRNGDRICSLTRLQRLLNLVESVRIVLRFDRILLSIHHAHDGETQHQ